MDAARAMDDHGFSALEHDQTPQRACARLTKNGIVAEAVSWVRADCAMKA